MAKGHVWTYTSTDIHDSNEEVNYYPCWLVWTSLEPMRKHIVEGLWQDMCIYFDRELSDKELVSLRSQVNEFVEKDVRSSRENELTITLDDNGEEEDYRIIRVWSMSIQ